MALFILEACQSWKQLSLPGGGRQLRAWELSQSPPRLSPVLGIVKQMALVWQTWLKEILTKTVMVPNDQAVSRPSLNFLINERCRHHHLPYLVVIIIMTIIIMLIVIIIVITALISTCIPTHPCWRGIHSSAKNNFFAKFSNNIVTMFKPATSGKNPSKSDFKGKWKRTNTKSAKIFDFLMGEDWEI